MRGRLALLLSLLAVAAVAVWAWRRPPVRVDVAAVERGPMRVTVDEEGKTRVRQRFVVAAPVAGRLERITLDEGDDVATGDVVARLHPLPLDPRTFAEASARLEAAEAQKREADARVAQLTAAFEQARRAADRARRLRREGTISVEELELTELTETTRAKELEAAVFGARAADHHVAAARAALLAPGSEGTVTVCGDGQEPCLELRAPVRGVVLRVLEESERVVAVGTPLIEFGDPSDLEAIVDLLSTDAVRVRAGDEVWIEDWGGERPLRARVRRVEPSGFTKLSALGVEEQRVNVIADFIDPPGALGDAYRLEARVVVWQGDEVSKVPASALFRHAGDWHVFVVAAGRAVRRPITIGHRNATEVEVLDGLAAGETVILHPSDLVDDGVRITSP